MASRRQIRLWLSIALTAIGLLLVTWIGLRRQVAADTDLKSAGDSVTQIARSGDGAANAPPIRLVDEASERGIVMTHGPGARNRLLTEDTGSGLAWGDYDSDGDFDLYLVNFRAQSAPAGTDSRNRLYRNDGSTFVDVTERAGVGDPEGFGMGAAFADFDGDGDLDLYVTNVGPNRLFVNRGDGRFSERAEQYGVAGSQWSIGASWGDYDRDSRLDLYVSNYVDYDARIDDRSSGQPEWQSIPLALNPNVFDPQANQLYHQRHDGRFVDVGPETGVSNPRGRGMATTFFDHDGDGWLDLYVANDVSANALYRNRAAELGAALFEDASAATGTADPRGSMGLSVADVIGPDGATDGRADLFVSHWVTQENAFYVAVTANSGRIEYRDRIRQLGAGELSTDRVGWGSGFVDLDLDGRLDLAIANGSTLELDSDPSRLEAQAPFLLWNDGQRFWDIAGTAIGDQRWVARGLAVCDFDRDLDSDLAISVNRGAPLLLVNHVDDTAQRSALAVRALAPAAMAHGARISVRVGEQPQTRWLAADASYASGHCPELLFGLGTARSSAEIVVEWLGGPRQILRAVPSRRVIVVSRG